MLQEILLGLVFLAALAYLCRMVYLQFQARSGCASGCGKCSAVDFKKIEAELKQKGL
jgi:bacterioferritin-associated ferredoxin